MSKRWFIYAIVDGQRRGGYRMYLRALGAALSVVLILDPWLAYARVSHRTVSFSSYRWGVKHTAGVKAGPGPNYFSHAEENAWIDLTGSLHLKITQQAGRYRCAEVSLTKSLGYGAYTIQVASRLDSLDAHAVVGMFIYRSDVNEIDIEFSPALVPAPCTAQYVVQPYMSPGNRYIFSMPAARLSSHRLEWRADRIVFTSWEGWTPFPPSPQKIIANWMYTGPDIPLPGDEHFYINYWLFGGRPPARSATSELIIRSFSYQP